MRIKYWAILFCLASITNFQDVSASSTHVHGHVTKKGSYVQPHRRTSPDKHKYNNWSSKGNVNPYTGKKGTKKP